MEWTSYAKYKTLGDHDILYVVGGGTSAPEWWRKYLLSRVAYFKEVAEQLHMTRWKFTVVAGLSHEDDTKYFPYVRDWAAGK